MPCAFCGNDFQRPHRPRSAEHVWPLWLDHYLPNPGEDFTVTVRGSETGEVKSIRTSAELDVVSRKVCEPCNNNWMNDLENLARPYLVTVLQGHGRPLYQEAQTALATWAVKTALVVQLISPPHRISDAHYRAMTARKSSPPDKVIVWLGAYEGFRHLFAAPNHLEMTRPSTGSVSHADFTTLAIGHAIFQVLIHNEDGQVAIERGARANMATQIWPILGVVRHPPPVVVTEASLLTLSRPFSPP
jgi:hypothetical protein